MKRYLVLLIALATLALFIPACGGGGGGGGATVGSTNVLKEIALFANTTYTYYLPGLDTEDASNMEAALRDMGHTVTPFTGTSASDFASVLSGKDVLVIPNLDNADLNAVLDTATRTIISDFVSNGGIFILNNTWEFIQYSDNLINAAFGYSIVTTASVTGTTITLDTSAAVGTPFEDAVPSTITVPSTIFVIDTTTLPANAKALYTDPSGNAALVYIPEGYGHIVLLSYSWYKGKPVGTQDGGWWNVLYRAASLNGNYLNVGLLHANINTNYVNAAVDLLKGTGQFATVGIIDATASTPSLAQLQAYDALIVSSFSAFADSVVLGDNLADYVDGGGGVVVSFADYAPGFQINGRFLSDNYYAIPPGAITSGAAVLGTTYYNSHPTVSGVQTFDGGTAIRPDTTSVVSGSTAIARWDDSRTLLATREINGVRRADLGFFPYPAPVYSSGFDTTTDGDLLMANALTWVSDLPEPTYTSYVTADAPQSLTDFTTTTSTISISGGPSSISAVKVTFDAKHTWLQALDISLISAQGTTIFLGTDNGGGAGSFSNTILDDTAGVAIEGVPSTFAPYTGSFIPEEPLTSMRGEDANGTWSLLIYEDDDFGDAGTLFSWSISVR